MTDESLSAAFLEMTEVERRAVWKHIQGGEYSNLHTHGVRSLPAFLNQLELKAAPPTNTLPYVRWLIGSYMRHEFFYHSFKRTQKVLTAFEEMRESLPEGMRELRAETTLKEIVAIVKQNAVPTSAATTPRR